MKTSLRCASFLSALLASASLFAADATPARSVVIKANDTLHFNVTRIEARPGERLHVQVRNDGTMPKEAMGHNWVLLTSDEDPNAYAAAAVGAKATAFLPPDLANKVIASVGLLGPGESADVTFTAPTAPGKYPFLCSFPAHCSAGMRGVLIVK